MDACHAIGSVSKLLMDIEELCQCMNASPYHQTCNSPACLCGISYLHTFAAQSRSSTMRLPRLPSYHQPVHNGAACTSLPSTPEEAARARQGRVVTPFCQRQQLLHLQWYLQQLTLSVARPPCRLLRSALSCVSLGHPAMRNFV